MEKTLLKKYILLIFCLFLTISTSVNFAQEPSTAPPQAIGQVVWVKNTLKAQQPNAEPRILARRAAIYAHDTLTTDNNSSGEIGFTDDSALALQEDSTIKIDQYKHGKENASSSDAFVVNVIKGGFRTITGIISKNNPGGYVANTPVATIGVRGTLYSIYYNALKKTLSAKIDKGSIVVSNPNGKVTLAKCDNNSSKTICTNMLFAEVHADSAPTLLSEQPIVFNNEPTLVMPGPSTKSGGSGLVGSFCIQ